MGSTLTEQIFLTHNTLYIFLASFIYKVGIEYTLQNIYIINVIPLG